MQLLKNYFNKTSSKVLLKRTIICGLLIFGLGSMFPTLVLANDGPRPPHTISSIGIAEKVIPHLFDYMHFKVIGGCLWWHCKHPWDCHVIPTLEIDEYLPDLVVSSYTGKGNNPYWEAAQMDKAIYPAGNSLLHSAMRAKTGLSVNADLANGNASTVSDTNHYSSLRTKSVDVIGSPLSLFHIPFVMLSPNTIPLVPYYQSDMDSLGKLGLAELIRPETLLPTHCIGSNFLNHWGYEFPRNMTVNVYNDYKASVIAALRAADIVTNHNGFHTVKSTSNSCGNNCVVSNVIEENNDDHEIWQEVYPEDKHIHPGKSDLTTINSMGNEDAQKGNNNYVFVVWRRYRGCIQADGRLFYKSCNVGSPQKR